MKRVLILSLALVVLVSLAYGAERFFYSPVPKIALNFTGSAVISKCTQTGKTYYAASQGFQAGNSITTYFYDTRGNQVGYTMANGKGKGTVYGIKGTFCRAVYLKK